MKGVRAKKHLGQHFLNNRKIAFNITKLLNKKIRNVIYQIDVMIVIYIEMVIQIHI